MPISLVDRWNSDEDSEKMTICISCKHYGAGLRCAAFPDGIPQEIWNTENNHSVPLPGQGNAIVFEVR
jgi:hypothetical protein